MLNRIIRQDSKEYVSVTLTSPDDITGDPVAMSFDNGVTWHAAEVTGAEARVLVGPGEIMLAKAKLFVLVKVTDNPEVPIFVAGGALTVV